MGLAFERENTLWYSSSRLGKLTVVPLSTGSASGTNWRFFCSSVLSFSLSSGTTVGAPSRKSTAGPRRYSPGGRARAGIRVRLLRRRPRRHQHGSLDRAARILRGGEAGDEESRREGPHGGNTIHAARGPGTQKEGRVALYITFMKGPAQPSATAA